MLRKLVVVAALGLMITGCGGNPAETVDEFLAENNPEKARSWLNEQLSDSPDDPLLNALAAEVKTSLCAQTNCTSKNITLLGEISRHLIRAGNQPLKIDDDVSRDFYTKVLTAFEGFARNEEHPAPMMAFLNKALPPNAPTSRFYDFLAASALQQFQKMQVPKAKAIFKAMTTLPQNSPYNTYANLCIALMSNDAPAEKASLEEIHKGKKTIPVPLAKSLPYALFLGEIEADQENGALLFTGNMHHRIENMALPGGNTLARPLSESLLGMLKNKPFMDMAVQYVTPLAKASEKKEGPLPQAKAGEKAATKAEITPLTPTPGLIPPVEEAALPGEAEKRELLRLSLLKMVLVIDPDRKEIWDQFLQPAMTFVDKTGNVDLLFSDIDHNKIPQSAAQPYNERLFRLIDRKLAEGESVVSLLRRVIVAETDQALTEKINTLVKDALKKALEENNTGKVVDYASYRPDLARPERQQIVNLVIESLHKMWQEDNFSRMSEMARFLSEDMEIDFNLENLLLQNFNEYMVKISEEENFSTDSPEALLKTQIDVQVSLGEKFKFMRKHFAKNPETVDAVLKTAVINAGGAYGTPVSFFRMFHLFDDKTFPVQERNEFLVGAVKDAFSRDESLSALEASEVGYQLVKHHPDIPLIFVIGETLKRITGLEESRKVWASVNDEFRENLRTVRPQFTTLMEAIDAFDAGKKREAMGLFGILSDRAYLEQAEPYFEKFHEMTKDYGGTFLSQGVDEKMHALLVTIYPNKNTEIPSEMLNFEVSFINAVGSVMIKANQELVEDYGQTFLETIRGTLDPDTMTIIIGEEQRAGATLPQSFERTFGEIIGIKLEADGSISAQVATGKTYPFLKITDKTDNLFFPNGRYGITEQVSVSNRNTDHVIPVGSILTLKTDKKRPLQPMQEGKKLAMIYPVSGTILHPSSPEPRPVSGYYSVKTHVANINYDYPIGKSSGTLQAIVRCHIIDTYLVCAGHNKHWSRLRYSHIVEGHKAEDAAADATPGTNGLLPPPETTETEAAPTRK